MAAGRDDHLGLDDVGVHAGLGVVVEGDERPVGHHAADVLAAADNLLAGILAHDQILAGSGIEELDVGHLESAGGGEGTVRRDLRNNRGRSSESAT